MSVEERDAQFLIKNGYFEKCEDLEYQGRKLLCSRLGYRMTRRFVVSFFGRMFNHPHVVFADEMLKPELQDMGIFADGIDNIVETQRRVSAAYFQDGSLELACPPVKALLHIMRDDHWEGRGLEHPEFRKLFTRESMVASDWYQERLKAKQTIDLRLWRQHVGYLKAFLNKTTHHEEAGRLGIHGRLTYAEQELARVKSPAYLEHLHGTLGAEPSIAARLSR